MQTIENDHFKVTINELGAEITSIYNKTADFEYIWNNEIWPKHAPVLFPAIGRSEADAYTYHDKQYPMPQHGFISGQTFDVLEQTHDSLVLGVTDSGDTHQYFPFSFQFKVKFVLTERSLALTFTVNNTDAKEFAFSLGSHPAFNVPIADEGTFDDYQIDFKPKFETLTHFEIVKTPAPYRSGKLIPVEGYQDGTLMLSHDLFEAGLIIIENKGIQSLTLHAPKAKHQVKIDLGDFRYVCLWTKEGTEAPFLCIEPFAGLPDVTGKMSDLLTKEANTKLAPGFTKAFNYNIQLG
ncbi:aldose 1-epimerase family protein [Lactobacillus sp. CC-MHH1034]|uniref:aldose 1-epimerase family protein n=1 Tax=Agrilactobacillus fermenti TaxID=2586909 RepID=UPI001E55B0CD|nr:aldose 1-epimerase family protein [Agrilactobacillus fermenti]MCD2256035.1 aldose 1-epimerase family protein [Agrilactobacillus fermenti]